MNVAAYSSSAKFFEGISPERRFVQVTAQNGQELVLRNIFEKVLRPLYGDQTQALNKIVQGKDRLGYILYERETPVGIIAFKNSLSNEFADFGIRNSIEIKSLFVVDATHNSGRGLGKALLHKVFEEADRLGLAYDSVHVTVSESKKESLIFFLSRDFCIRHIWIGKYQKGSAEYLLFRAGRVDDVAQRVFHRNTPFSEEEKKLSSDRGLPFASEMLGYVPNAHWDDIHALRLLSDGTIISGSKDNTLRKWDQEGNLVKIVRDVEPMGTDSEEWITAITPLNDEYWISGERTGKVSLWTTSGDYVKELQLKFPKEGHYSKPYNRNRVNCLARGLNPQKLSFFAGMPTLFDEYNLIEGRTVSKTHVHANDWVYCIHPLDQERLLLVIADTLALWRKQEERWKEEKRLQTLPAINRKRRHISCLTSLEPSSEVFAMGVFDGSVQAFNISTQKCLWSSRGHNDKVWAVEKFTESLFSSGGEDGKIFLWDVRTGKNEHSLEGRLGRVTALLRLSEYGLVAGSSNKSFDAGNGAQLVFYDIRK